MRAFARRSAQDLDAIVIGSGMGGLCSAAMLAKMGKRVLVLEQHYIAGGCTHVFDDKGAHAIRARLSAAGLTGGAAQATSSTRGCTVRARAALIRRSVCRAGAARARVLWRRHWRPGRILPRGRLFGQQDAPREVAAARVREGRGALPS